MIQIEFFQTAGSLTGFRATGHAPGKRSGHNVLCAFVSSACEMAANTLTEVLGIDATVKSADGFLEVNTGTPLDAAQPTLQGLKLHLETLAADYANSIKIIFLEV